MSLIKQLWLAIGFLMTLSFLGSFIVSSFSTTYYLEEQLTKKNSDNTNALALSLSSEQRDAVEMELFIAAQFDSGHYKYIRLVGNSGDILVEKIDSHTESKVPSWFKSLFPIDAPEGIAQISQGWQLVGTLHLRSQDHFAYQSLWSSTQRLFYYFITFTIFSCVIGTLILKVILKPLGTVVEHAKAIGQRRFVSNPLPRTLEFREVINSMNTLSSTVKVMIDEETAKLEKLRKSAHEDEVTKLMSREPTLSYLKSLLHKEDARATGTLLLIKIDGLKERNSQHGRSFMDDFLRKLSKSFVEFSHSNANSVVGRINGSDFLLIFPRDNQPEAIANEVRDQINMVKEDLSLNDLSLPIACTTYYSGEETGELLRRLDAGTDQSRDSMGSAILFTSDRHTSVHEADRWGQILHEALLHKSFSLATFPVRDVNDELLHLEAPLRLTLNDGSEVTAGIFMPHIARLNLGPQVDLVVVEKAIDLEAKLGQPIGINLSSAILNQTTMIHELKKLVISKASHAENLWFEVPEYGAFQFLEGFRELCQALKFLGCKVGIEHVGHHVDHIGKLHDLGLDYVKIDRSLTHDVDIAMENQVFLRGLCLIVHSIGLVCIAEGVEKKTEWDKLKELGFDGGTGKYFS